MSESKLSTPEKAPATDSTEKCSDETSKDRSRVDPTTEAAKILQQDFIKLTATNFETAMKELQKMAAARNPVGTEASAGTIPQANAQLEKTVQNLVTFLVHGSSEIAMRASTCINEARQTAQSLIETAICQDKQDKQRERLDARNGCLLVDAGHRQSGLPFLNIEARQKRESERSAAQSVHARGSSCEDDDLVVTKPDYCRVNGLS